MISFTDVSYHLKLFKPESVPEADSAVLTDRYDLLLLVVDEHVEDVFALVRLSLVGDAESVGVYGQHEAFSTASDHDTERG